MQNNCSPWYDGLITAQWLSKNGTELNPVLSGIIRKTAPMKTGFNSLVFWSRLNNSPGFARPYNLLGALTESLIHPTASILLTKCPTGHSHSLARHQLSCRTSHQWELWKFFEIVATQGLYLQAFYIYWNWKSVSNHRFFCIRAQVCNSENNCNSVGNPEEIFLFSANPKFHFASAHEHDNWEIHGGKMCDSDLYV